MKRPSKQIEIHGKQYEIVQLAPLAGLELLPEIARLLGPLAERLLGDGFEVDGNMITLLDLADGNAPPEVVSALIRNITVTLGKQKGADLRHLAIECCRGAKLDGVRIPVDQDADIIGAVIDSKVPSVAAVATLIWHQVMLIALPPTAGDAT